MIARCQRDEDEELARPQRFYAMSLDEIAAETGQSRKAVSMMIASGLRKIRQRRGLDQFLRLVELRRALADRTEHL